MNMSPCSQLKDLLWAELVQPGPHFQYECQKIHLRSSQVLEKRKRLKIKMLHNQTQKMLNIWILEDLNMYLCLTVYITESSYRTIRWLNQLPLPAPYHHWRSCRPPEVHQRRSCSWSRRAPRGRWGSSPRRGPYREGSPAPTPTELLGQTNPTDGLGREGRVRAGDHTLE